MPLCGVYVTIVKSDMICCITIISYSIRAVSGINIKSYSIGAVCGITIISYSIGAVSGITIKSYMFELSVVLP